MVEPLARQGVPLGAVAVQMLMGHHLVENQQKADAQQKADYRGQKRKAAHPAALVNGGNQKAPDRRCHHDPGGKAQKALLYPGADFPLKQKYTGSAQGGAQQGDQAAP